MSQDIAGRANLTGGPMSATPSIVREKGRHQMTGLSRVQWWRLEKAGIVPKRLQLGLNSVGWLRHELIDWIEERAAQRVNP
ncbi:MAG: AlpA family phage regulatory protein [Nitrospirales bacterium]